MRHALVGALAFALLGSVSVGAKPIAAVSKPKAEPAKTSAVLCEGEFADAVPADAAARIAEGLRDTFVFAIRNTATYEHVYYGRDGKLRRKYLRSVIHGTAFAYRRQGGDTLLATNEHVAAQPEVTDDDHRVESIPRGSKKVREQLRIVRNEEDDYEPGHVPLTKVLVDPSADLAILRTRKSLPLMPYRFGRSGALRAGNVVQVRGFPLGAFASLNSGKVTNPYTDDSEKGWAHADFMVDALLNGGNSGSPVFAISCKTGEPELVGLFHAGYSDAQALNAVVAIDQLREELETLKPTKRARAGRVEITGADRDRIVRELFTGSSRTLTFPFGGRSVSVRLTDPTTLRFAVLDDEYPLSTDESLSLIDRAQTGFGTLDAVANEQTDAVPLSNFDPEVRDHFDKLYDGLWQQLLGVVEYRTRLQRGRTNAEAFAEARAMRSRLRKKATEQKDLLNICSYEADRASLVTEKPVAGDASAQPLADGTPASAAGPVSTEASSAGSAAASSVAAPTLAPAP